MGNLNVNNRTIFCKDNLEILKEINSDSIDLIYLDPPFNKNKIFTAPIGTSAEGASFKDIFTEEDIKGEWAETIKEDNEKLYALLEATKLIEGRIKYNYCYLCYMGIRMIEMQRILKDTGSIFLHCDQTMSHYLKLLMDCIFGENNSRGEIIWQRTQSAQKGSQYRSRSWGNNIDNIFHYTKTNRFVINTTRDITQRETLEKFKKTDEKGNSYNIIPIYRSKSMGSRPNLCYEWRGFNNPHPTGWRLSKERLEEEYQKGNVVIQNGKIERRQYIKNYIGVPMGNLWTDINPARGRKNVGYPTQKPLPLLERIINSSSNKGDVVLDPFCGCATTCVAAERLERQWVGIDVSRHAYDLVKERLAKEVYPDLFDPNKVPDFLVDPPERTDRGRINRDAKWVYVISNTNFQNEYKVGVALNYKQRLNSYQTSDPNRAYKLEHKIHTAKYKEMEKHIHQFFNSRHEWVTAKLEDIKAEINKYENTDQSLSRLQQQ